MCRINYFLVRDECSLVELAEGREEREIERGGERKASGCCVRWVPAVLVQRLTAARHAATNCNVVVAACCNMLRGSKQKLLQLQPPPPTAKA